MCVCVTMATPGEHSVISLLVNIMVRMVLWYLIALKVGKYATGFSNTINQQRFQYNKNAQI